MIELKNVIEIDTEGFETYCKGETYIKPEAVEGLQVFAENERDFAVMLYMSSKKWWKVIFHDKNELNKFVNAFVNSF